MPLAGKVFLNLQNHFLVHCDAPYGKEGNHPICNKGRPNTGIGGLTPVMKLKPADCSPQIRPLKNRTDYRGGAGDGVPIVPRRTRCRAHVVPADAREEDYSRQTIYCLEAGGYWEARRTLDILFGTRWENLTKAWSWLEILCGDTVSVTSVGEALSYSSIAGDHCAGWEHTNRSICMSE